MDYQQTSLFAYSEVKPELGVRQQQVLDVISKHKGIDNLMIAQILKLPINSITPRVKELRQKGKVKEWGKKKSTLTGRTVIGWEAYEN